MTQTEQVVLHLMHTPKVGEKTLTKILIWGQEQGVPIDCFLQQEPEGLQTGWKAIAPEALEQGRQKAKDLPEQLKSHGIEMLILGAVNHRPHGLPPFRLLCRLWCFPGEITHSWNCPALPLPVPETLRPKESRSPLPASSNWSLNRSTSLAATRMGLISQLTRSHWSKVDAPHWFLPREFCDLKRSLLSRPLFVKSRRSFSLSFRRG